MAALNPPVLDTLLRMNEGIPERSGLDDTSFMLVRLAALAATGGPPAAYLMNLEVAEEIGLSAEQVEGVLIAIAPVVGSARVASAGNAIGEALGLATAVAEKSG